MDEGRLPGQTPAGTRDVPKPSAGWGIAGFVCGVVSLVGGLCLTPVGLVLAVIAIVFSAVQMHRHTDGFAVAGLVLGIIGFVLHGVAMLFGAALLAGLLEAMREVSQQSPPPGQ